MTKLELVCPNVYKIFCSGNFVVQKTINLFATVALDQAHEKSNTIVKRVAVSVSLLSKDMDSALSRWEIAGLDVWRLLEEYERLYNITSNENKGKHQEDYTEFQKALFNDTQKLFFYFIE